MDTVLKNTLDEIEGRLAEILAVLKDIRTQGSSITITIPPEADREITGFCKCGEELYVETVDGERFIACR